MELVTDQPMDWIFLIWVPVEVVLQIWLLETISQGESSQKMNIWVWQMF